MREYNAVHHVGRLVVQVLLSGQKGLVIWLVPSVTLTIGGQYLLFGLGFDWLWGTFNIGIMNAKFAASERKRLSVPV